MTDVPAEPPRPGEGPPPEDSAAPASDAATDPSSPSGDPSTDASDPSTDDSSNAEPPVEPAAAPTGYQQTAEATSDRAEPSPPGEAAASDDGEAPSEALDAHEPTEAGQEPAETEAEASGDQAGEEESAQSKRKRRRKSKSRRSGDEAPTTAEVRDRVGTTNEAALAYVDQPDHRLSRLPRGVREELIAELPSVTAAALLGPAALARHFVASAASGRYRDLFALWRLFSAHPEVCKPELATRGAALERARRNLRLATELGLLGRADRVAEDVAQAEGLIWQWLREVLDAHPKAVAERPAVAAALLARGSATSLPLPDHPSPRWLAEAVEVKERGELPSALEERLQANVHRMPATIATLRLAVQHYPDRVHSLLDSVDLDAPDVEAFLAWARDHGAVDRLVGRIRDRVNAAAARDRAEGLTHWDTWRRRGIELPLPAAVKEGGVEGLDLTRPETAHLAARLEAEGASTDMQRRLDELAARNRQLAEKAYEAAVCAGLDVTLPTGLEQNPIVKEGTRCPRCRAWTWVRPGHEERCPRPMPATEPSPTEAFELAAAEASKRT